MNLVIKVKVGSKLFELETKITEKKRKKENYDIKNTFVKCVG